MNETNHQLAREFIKSACFRMDESLRMIRLSFGHLSEEELWKRPGKASNSPANLILHLQGNIRQYAISSLAGLPDLRERDKEFSSSGGPGKKRLLQGLEDTIRQAGTN